MSKKSRRRNKRLLALAGLAGAVALSRRNKLANATETNNPVGGVDQIAADAKKDSPKKDTSKSDVVAATPKKVSVPVGKMRGAGTDESAIAGQKTRADYAKNARINAMNTAEGSPMIDNPYKTKPNPRGRGNFMKSGGRAGLKSGGKVRGCGIAKRGLGRAMKKGKR